MRRPFIVVALLFLLQVVPRAQAGNGSVEGVVLSAGTNAPLAGARVSLSPVTTGTVPSAGPIAIGAVGGLPAEATIISSSPTSSSSIALTTNSDGRFVFQNLNAGLYSLQVLRDGYARQSYGQRVPGGSATAINLASGQSIRNIVMTMILAGNVSGAVRGPDGQPQTGVPVQLLRAIFNSSGQRKIGRAHV